MHKKNYLLLLTCILFSCSKKKINVNAIEISSPSYDRFNKIKFFSATIGFIVGGQQYLKPTMLKTTDGGSTWNEVNLPSNNEQKEIYGIDVFSNGNLITVGYGGTIFISDDTGKSFQYVQHNSWKELHDVAFQNKDTAYIVGGIFFSNGHISEFKTDGSGNNQIKENLGFELSDIDIVDTNTIYYSGYGAILKSVDAGKTHDFTKAKNDFFKAMCWKNSLEGVAVGYEGSIIRTTNGGDSWKIIRNGNDFTKKKIHFLDVERNQQKKIVAVGEKGIMYVSYDDGSSWAEANHFTNKDLYGVVFRDEETCFMVGENGTIYQTTL